MKKHAVPQIRFSVLMMVTAAFAVGVAPIIPIAHAALPTASEMRTIHQIAQVLQDQNPKQADSSSNQCFLEIMEEKQQVESFPAPSTGTASNSSRTRPACRETQPSQAH